ncbi:hypothetical protein BHE74_00027714 [Ensete ventricosum]|nr:hypothetical protein BHE74_00027714 [Ensete ventricosum]
MQGLTYQSIPVYRVHLGTGTVLVPGGTNTESLLEKERLSEHTAEDEPTPARSGTWSSFEAADVTDYGVADVTDYGVADDDDERACGWSRIPKLGQIRLVGFQSNWDSNPIGLGLGPLFRNHTYGMKVLSRTVDSARETRRRRATPRARRGGKYFSLDLKQEMALTVQLSYNSDEVYLI